MGESRVRKHDVDGHAQFRFKTAGKTFRPRYEEVYVARQRVRIGEKRAAYIRQYRKMSASVKELLAEWAFEIGQGLAHLVLGATCPAAGRRETALIRGRNESAQLI